MSIQERFYAHSKGNDISAWQTLTEHLRNVSMLCSDFASTFDSGNAGKLIGMLHDIGKSRSSFQSYLRRCNGIEEGANDYGDHTHSDAGACWLQEHKKKIRLGEVLSYCIAGHHAGLPDFINGSRPNGTLSSRFSRCDVLKEKSVNSWLEEHQQELEELSSKELKPFMFSRQDTSLSFWVRMLFSCLVDADYLDTEKFMTPEQSAFRSQKLGIAELSVKFTAAMDAIEARAPSTPINQLRKEIREACEKSSSLPMGLFSLTVPTGGGKTLSSMAFALRHALVHKAQRIIVVIPYTSIIEQTSAVLRSILGEENVVEHHSNLNPEHETIASRLATENWDAPIIVTTSVQFFETLYANSTSKCRKLHNIANSVVIIDETQLLPSGLLVPCTEALRLLTDKYHTTVVLSTATQMRLPGIEPTSIHEIMMPQMQLYEKLKRTEIQYPENLEVRQEWKGIAAEISAYRQVLCIVNSRLDCRELFSFMPEGTFHLSALMCGEHRTRVLAEIKQRLQDGQEVRVVSTQLVEAGVDIDFPVVYRALTGLPSIVQTAGRCNREGKLAKHGQVIVFVPPKQAPVGELRKAEDAMFTLLKNYPQLDANNPETYDMYFNIFHNSLNNQGEDILKLLTEPGQYQFREAAEKFRMIDDQANYPILVRYKQGAEFIDQLISHGPSKELLRKLQRYTVSVSISALKQMLDNGVVEEIHNWNKDETGFFALTEKSTAYSDTIGLDVQASSFAPEGYVY